ncbi:MAG: DUF1697 domain-containing protein [Acidimicrobiales bacterium]
MSTRIAFLRAVNLGRRRVSMPRVVEIFENAGFAGPWTFGNTGNVVFEATGPRADLERTLDHSLERTFGFEVTTFVRTAAETLSRGSGEAFRSVAGRHVLLDLLEVDLDRRQAP